MTGCERVKLENLCFDIMEEIYVKSALNWSKEILLLNKLQKDHNINNKKYNTNIKQKRDNKNQSQIILDVVQESYKKYRELESIAIDPEYIIEEQKKRQPLSFEE